MLISIIIFQLRYSHFPPFPHFCFFCICSFHILIYCLMISQLMELNFSDSIAETWHHVVLSFNFHRMLNCVQIEKYEKDERTMQLGMSKTDYPFDYFFERSCKERAAKKENERECTWRVSSLRFWFGKWRRNWCQDFWSRKTRWTPCIRFRNRRWRGWWLWSRRETTCDGTELRILCNEYCQMTWK